jgi:hypothetical protein
MWLSKELTRRRPKRLEMFREKTQGSEEVGGCVEPARPTSIFGRARSSLGISTEIPV